MDIAGAVYSIIGAVVITSVYFKDYAYCVAGVHNNVTHFYTFHKIVLEYQFMAKIECRCVGYYQPKGVVSAFFVLCDDYKINGNEY